MTQTTAEKAVERLGIVADVERVPGEHLGMANAYSVTLRLDGREMVVPFGTGSGWDHDPTAADVLEALASDASGVENASSFEDWAGDDYDTDSRKAFETYTQAVAQTTDLRALLGDHYDAVVWETLD